MYAYIIKSFIFTITILAIAIISPVHAQQNITTGNASATNSITNTVDTNYNCNCTPTPTQTPTPTPTSTPTPTPTLTPTPTNTPSPTPIPTNTPDENGGSSNPSNAGGMGGGIVMPQQAVLGLSTTSSGTTADLMKAIGAFVLSTTGLALLNKKNA